MIYGLPVAVQVAEGPKVPALACRRRRAA
jgi:hypothetical protein